MVESNYDILDITDGSSRVEIRTAFRKLVLEHHSDRGGDDEQFKKIKQAFDDLKIGKKYPSQAQYVVNFAYNYPYFMHLNLREACHLIELRTVPQGHIDYREVAQKMFKEIKKVHPNLSKIIKFVDLKKYELERFESEKRTEEKKRKQ
jgi:thymidylate synthase ThyX